MPLLKKFLVVDDNADGRALLGRTLIRKFPSAAIVECGDGNTAITLAGTEHFDGIVVHRAGEFDGESLVRSLRQVARDVAIIMVSGVDRTAAAMAAGATAFLEYDRWLMLGSLVEEILNGDAA